MRTLFIKKSENDNSHPGRSYCNWVAVVISRIFSWGFFLSEKLLVLLLQLPGMATASLTVAVVISRIFSRGFFSVWEAATATATAAWHGFSDRKKSVKWRRPPRSFEIRKLLKNRQCSTTGRILKKMLNEKGCKLLTKKPCLGNFGVVEGFTISATQMNPSTTTLKVCRWFHKWDKLHIMPLCIRITTRIAAMLHHPSIFYFI